MSTTTPTTPHHFQDRIKRERALNASSLPHQIRRYPGVDSLTCEMQGNAVRLKYDSLGGLGGGKRNAITGFTKRSAKNLADKLASLEEQEIQFITLTYPPEEVSEDPSVWKDQLELFFQRMRYDFPDFSLLWRLEKQGNGSPHFHCLAFNVSLRHEHEKTCKFNAAIVRHWQEITSTRTLPNVQLLQNRIGAYLYICGHSAKSNQVWTDRHVGRYWGILGRQEVRFAELFSGEPSVRVLRFLRRYWHSHETSRLNWLANRGRKGKRRKLNFQGKYFFRIPVSFLLDQAGIPPEERVSDCCRTSEISCGGI